MRTLLIDADVVAYNAAFGAEKAVEFEPGYWTWHVAWDEVLTNFDAEIERMMETLSGDAFKLCLTDSEGNFRLGIHGAYKDSRRKTRKPIVLKAFKQFLVDERQAYWKPGLEGDDVMGILATHPKLIPGEKIIVSIDKDMKTIPSTIVRWGTDEGLFERVVDENEADYWHLFQTLTGDTTDGYKGCPGIGPKKAEAILEPARAGWSREFAWEYVKATYEKAGLTEDDAIIQARMARILRSSDYDFNKKEPILWNPPA